LLLAALAGVATAVVHGAQALQRDARAELVRGTAGIAGFVVNEASGQPVRRVEVTLSSDAAGGSRRTYTDDVGSFSFPNLPAGRYLLSATRPGYVRTAYGAKRHDRPGTPIHLAAGQTLTNIRLATYKGGVITGQVLDETGLPAFGVLVRALEYRTVLGERRLARARAQSGGLLGEETDDRGMYRLYGLPPGEYVIVASPRVARNEELRAMTDAEIRDALQAAARPPQAAPAAAVGAASAAGPASPPVRRDEGATVGYAPVFYPGTTSASGANTIVLQRGEERAGVDFQIQLVQTARIEGTIIPPAGVPPQSVQLMLVAHDELGAPGALGLSILNRATPDADGTFTYRAVAPGRYTLTARATLGGPGRGDVTVIYRNQGVGAMAAAPPPPLPPGTVADPSAGARPAYWALSEISVSGQDVENVVLALEPAMTMTGQVRFEGSATPPRDLGRVRLSLPPAPSPDMQVSTVFPNVTVTHTGEFTVSNITPGRYVMTGSVPTPSESFTPATWRLKSAIVNGRDILDFPLEVGPYQNLSDAVVTFTDVTQSVSGALQDPTGRPAPDYTIVVFADDPACWLPGARRIRTARPGTDGRFSIQGLPAGGYRMAAVVDMADEDAFDPAFLEQLVPASFAFTLGEGEAKVQDMRIAGGGH
jgi:hypothetical protein